MILAKRLRGKAIATWLGPAGDAARKAVAKVKGTFAPQPNRIDFYVDIADPWSYLTAQAVQRLVKAYPVELGVHIVTPPASDVDPAPHLRVNHAVRDAKQLAEYWDLDFPGKREADSGLVRDIATTLIRERPAAEQLQAVLDLLGALWANDKKQVAAILGKLGADSHGSVAPVLNSNYAALRKAGHYQGAMLHYGDTWYWGIDRLPYLEQALAKELGTEVTHVVSRRGDAEREPQLLSKNPLTCEMWISYRSPYSYLALEQIEAVLAPYQVPLVLRQVQPMVTRGLAVPSVKRMYIVHDAKREADRLNIPFGELCDPLGAGVDNCLAIHHWAAKRSQADALAFAKSAMRAIWTEARDVAEYVDLKFVVERAGLPWEEAKASLGNPEAVKAATVNAADLAVVNLWGVPSFRCGDFVAWGQDRLPLLADQLRRHAAAVLSPP